MNLTSPAVIYLGVNFVHPTFFWLSENKKKNIYRLFVMCFIFHSLCASETVKVDKEALRDNKISLATDSSKRFGVIRFDD